jgi:histidine ammonia-lyase
MPLLLTIFLFILFKAKILDFMTIAIHEIGSMAERRIDRLMTPSLSGLPAFLAHQGGLNSGFMLAHVTAAALVSENKTLCHPASVDSITTSAGKEDHVSMGGFAARKCRQVVDNVVKILAIEWLAAAQGLEFARPLRSTAPVEAIQACLRDKVPEWDKDRYMAPDIEQVPGYAACFLNSLIAFYFNVDDSFVSLGSFLRRL